MHEIPSNNKIRSCGYSRPCIVFKSYKKLYWCLIGHLERVLSYVTVVLSYKKKS